MFGAIPFNTTVTSLTSIGLFYKGWTDGQYVVLMFPNNITFCHFRLRRLSPTLRFPAITLFATIIIPFYMMTSFQLVNFVSNLSVTRDTDLLQFFDDLRIVFNLGIPLKTAVTASP